MPDLTQDTAAPLLVRDGEHNDWQFVDDGTPSVWVAVAGTELTVHITRQSDGLAVEIMRADDEDGPPVALCSARSA